jgi:clan AA aspartic protease (TIGR02281 family)
LPRVKAAAAPADRDRMPRLAASLGPLALLCALLASGAGAEVYRWTDEEGRVHYAGSLSQVPASERAEALEASRQQEPSKLQVYESPAPAPGAARLARRTGVLRIPYEQHGNAILVYVRLNDRVTAPFYVDTGAADVVVPAAVAARAGVLVGADTPRETYATANGLIRQAVVQLDAVEVGEARVENVRGSVSQSLPVGLLGTSFFNHFTLQIDPAARMLTLTENPNMRGGASQASWSERFRELRDRIARLEAFLGQGELTSETRQQELEQRRDELVQQLEALEAEADRAAVPAAWRE